MEDAEQESYKLLVKDIQPLSYQDVAEDWEKNSKEWYHALIAIEDLPKILRPDAIPAHKIHIRCFIVKTCNSSIKMSTSENY